MFKLISALLMAVYATQAPAEPRPAFDCFTRDSLQALSVSNGLTRFNNVSIRERDAVLSAMPVVEVAYSVTNLTDRYVNVGGSVVGMTSAGEITFALSVAPLMDGVQSLMTDTGKNSVYVRPGTLERTAAVCVNFVSEIR